MTLEHINQELQTLKEKKNYRSLPPLIHEGRDVLLNGQRMLNLSSNDYLGLSNDISLRKEFLKTLTPETFLPTSSSSRLLTGNFSDYQKLEQQLATMFGTESALIFNSGYHANTGILPAICNTHTLILAIHAEDTFGNNNKMLISVMIFSNQSLQLGNIIVTIPYTFS